MKKIIPFSNGTHAMHWMHNNCDSCTTKSRCSAKRNIEFGFITGEITIKAAEFIGYNQKTGHLFNCQHKNKRVVKKSNSKQKSIKQMPKLF